VNSYMAESSIPVGARTGLRHAQPSATDSH
jgi:hypothetical protein